MATAMSVICIGTVLTGMTIAIGLAMTGMTMSLLFVSQISFLHRDYFAMEFFDIE
jgi:hypothetical protein